MKAAKIDKWPPDALRHSFASAHYAFHRDPARTAVTMGHRDKNMLLTDYRDVMKPSEAVKYLESGAEFNDAQQEANTIHDRQKMIMPTVALL